MDDDDDLEQELEMARRANDLERLKRAFENNTDENGRQIVLDISIRKLLYKAAGDDRNGVDVCLLFYNNLSEYDKQNFRKFSRLCPLVAAAESGNLEKVKFFLDPPCKCNVNHCDFPSETTPLKAAILAPRNAAETCGLLLSRGADAKERYLLYYAVKYNNNAEAFEVFRLLLKHGADPNKEDALFTAVLRNNPAVVCLLLEKCAIKPSQHHVDRAIEDGNGTILQIFLEHGARVRRNGAGLEYLLRSYGPSHQAKLNTCRILVEHAAQNSPGNNDNGSTVYLYATLAKCKRHNRQDACAILVEAGIDLLTALYNAVGDQNMQVTQWIMGRHRVNPFQKVFDCRTGEYSSPFRKAACLKDDKVIFNFLLRLWEQRFPNGINGMGNSTLHQVCREKHVTFSAIKAVMEADPKAISARNRQGLFPVELAVEANASLDVIFHLLKHYPDACSRFATAH